MTIFVVALYMSAWIEMNLQGKQIPTTTVALYMSAWIEIKMAFMLLNKLLVALYMSAWIEITLRMHEKERKTRRTLHECVD